MSAHYQTLKMKSVPQLIFQQQRNTLKQFCWLSLQWSHFSVSQKLWARLNTEPWQCKTLSPTIQSTNSPDTKKRGFNPASYLHICSNDPISVYPLKSKPLDFECLKNIFVFLSHLPVCRLIKQWARQATNSWSWFPGPSTRFRFTVSTRSESSRVTCCGTVLWGRDSW